MGLARQAVEAIGGNWAEVERYNNALERLRASRVAEINPEGDAAKSKVVWKIQGFQQVVLYRIVMLADGCAAAWNAGNPLSSILCARAIAETSAMLFDFEARLRAFCAAGDFPAIDALVMNRIFSNRLGWHKDAEGTEAISILTILQRVDKKLLPGIFRHYEILSEICHPNSLGHQSMFGEIDYKSATLRLSEEAALDVYHFDHMFTAFSLVELVERFLERIKGLEPRVLELSEAYKKTIGQPC